MRRKICMLSLKRILIFLNVALCIYMNVRYFVIKRIYCCLYSSYHRCLHNLNLVLMITFQSYIHSSGMLLKLLFILAFILHFLFCRYSYGLNTAALT